MADEPNQTKRNNTLLAFLLGAAVVALGVLGYIYYQQHQREVVRINVPGFSGTITKDRDGGFSGEFGREDKKGVDIKVD
ncbi:MAG TPA: hypothetical protein VNO69_03220 [Methyloceanibacter sp.]|nr:hypothetical protein [Methyloceanibacter sp.]